MRIGDTTLCLLVALLMALPAVGQAADKPDELAGTGYFRDQDTLPGSFRFYQQLPGGEAGLWGLGPTRKKISRSTFNADAHADVADYSPQSRCQTCHAPETRDLHGLRMGITCVQCHRNVPVAGVLHYYSALNPIRRHAYVCAKCHEGATPSFASYMVHEPNPLALRVPRIVSAALLRRLVHVDPGRRGVRHLPALYGTVVDTGVFRQTDREAAS